MTKACVSSYLYSQASSFHYRLPNYPHLHPPWCPSSVSSTLFSSSFRSSRTVSLHSLPVAMYLRESRFRKREREKERETYRLMHTCSLLINRTLESFSSGIHSGSLHTRISLSSERFIRFVSESYSSKEKDVQEW